MLNELYTFAEPVQVVPFSSLKWGKFTLLHTPVEEMAKLAVKLLFESIESDKRLSTQIELAPELIARDSVMNLLP